MHHFGFIAGFDLIFQNCIEINIVLKSTIFDLKNSRVEF